jgi:large subunit ribosomal protein L18
LEADRFCESDFICKSGFILIQSQIKNRKSKIRDKVMTQRNRAAVRSAVHKRIRRKVRGSTERPRLAVYRSLNHIYAQVIDDERGQTLVSASTTEKDLRGGTGGNVEAAQRVGRTIAERALAAGIGSVVFDRGGYLYHGRVKALTDAAREAGLNKDESAPAEGGESDGEQ